MWHCKSCERGWKYSMNTRLFRKSSIDRVNSPEQLNEYIRVTSPGMWLVLAAIILLLTGVVVWGVFGTVETTIEAGVLVREHTAVCYIAAEDASSVKEGMPVTAGDHTGRIRTLSETPVQVDDTFDDYMLYLTGMTAGDFCYVAELELPDVADGIYDAVITVDSIRPISFVIH